MFATPHEVQVIPRLLYFFKGILIENSFVRTDLSNGSMDSPSKLSFHFSKYGQCRIEGYDYFRVPAQKIIVKYLENTKLNW